MILVKKTALLSPRGAHGTCGVARFECFKEKSDVKISLAGGRKDLYAVVAVGDETRVVKLGADRIYLARTDLSGDCAVLVTDGEKRVICAGATVCGYDFNRLEEFLPEAFGEFAEVSDKRTDNNDKEQPETAESDEIQNYSETPEQERTDMPMPPEESVVSAEDVKEEKAETVPQEAETEKDSGKHEKETATEERFFDKISDKIEKLFKENEADDELNSLIPDSRWARVKTEDGWYVVGIVGDPEEFICYGIPADNSLDPPDEDEGCRQWLEVEKGGRGYWMMYQSAESGETLTAV